MFNRFLTLISASGLAGLLSAGAAQAICGVDYRVQPGDTLFSIAEAHYNDRSRWTLIYYSNQHVLEGPSVIPGKTLQIPCAQETSAPDPTPLRKDDAEMKLLTGSGFAPFTDKSLPGQGMVTELVNAAMELTPSPVSYSITWEADWSKHLFPMLDEKQFDMGFPWLKPDCATTPDDERCVNFHFSEPLITIPIMVFVRADAPFDFNTDADLIGKTLCRPEGYYSHDLDREGRRWLTEEKVTLARAANPAACFRRLMAGEVDAVSLNLFLGADTLLAEGLRDRVIPLERPVSEEGLHVVISKRHWRGTSHLYRINAGLKALKKDGRFQEIVSRHLELFWAQLQ
ncbi:transporter substrate-binding domain-containing protein [Phaeobacter sp.]|uniref:transporter substrate-binding domain-containing protein n=1 Tax=Phaeobacter sp. TaxID=1902409 RepID=UPI0025DCC71D|nr:transporter substrate-binding domain-containing protein [Phaeobacter sp.]